MVTVLNPTTGAEEKRALNEIASSHLARRTFIGNLYKKVKDPNLVGSLSGHKEGSKAFARYRDIDEDMKKELVDLLD
jgi:integrase